MSDQKIKVDELFIEQQRKHLEKLREKFLDEEKQSLAEERAFEEDHGAEAQEFEDQAQRMAQSEIRQALADVDKRRLRAIGRALQKIDEGTYGLSDMSGEPIPRAWLDAVPEAFLTAQEEEQKERQQK
jgi:DnaK suppressor protein